MNKHLLIACILLFASLVVSSQISNPSNFFFSLQTEVAEEETVETATLEVTTTMTTEKLAMKTVVTSLRLKAKMELINWNSKLGTCS